MDTYAISETVVLEWAMTDLAGAPITGAAVTGVVTAPGGATTNITAPHAGAGVYRAAFDPSAPGRYSWRLDSTGPDGARTGVFDVLPDPAPSAPPSLDPATPVGLVRLLIPDTDQTALLFNDGQITAFLGLNSADVRRAAAEALETVASNEAMVSKVITTQDLRTDGAAVAAELRARATSLRSEAKRLDDQAITDAHTAVGAFTIRPYGQPDCYPFRLPWQEWC